MYGSRASWSVLFAVLLRAALGQEGCSSTLIFASDTQEPMRVERLLLHEDGNKAATRALFKDMLSQEPTALFLLGDVVNMGHRARRWAFIDSALALASERGFDTHAILGNHELMGRAAKGERNFQQRFPGHVRTGYMVVKDSLAVLLLNSNFSKLSRADIAAQDLWYQRALAQVDSLPGVRAAIVCCHHSPYSYSRMVGSSEPVQKHFVAPFLKARKTALFLSGHAHLYQHFSEEGKHFFVIGGGGGLHHPFRKNTGPQVCLEPDYDPLFHYLTVRLCHGALQLISRRLNDDMSGFDAGRDYVVELPTGAVAVPTEGRP
jgi:Calcineurin-like phosphoesterase